MRKIIHIDMDAFYASVEQRDDPTLRGRPVVVAWRGARSVVCAASYEARTFGIHSAMPALRAERLCPDAVFVPPDFARYKAASKRIQEVFHDHTDLVQPLSLDEAFLDVTENRRGVATATELALIIREEIQQATGLTASAGIAPNKFLAKVASDWNKPNGQFVIRPHQVDAFLETLPVKRIPGVGKVMQEKLAALGVKTVGQLRQRPQEELLARFGRWGGRLYELSRGIDERPVSPDQLRKSLSAEDTFEKDLPLDALAPTIERLAERVWTQVSRGERVGRTVVLKLKTSDFRILSRSHTPAAPVASAVELTELALSLRQRVDLPPSTRYRLVGVGLDNFTDPDELQWHTGRLQAGLFD